MVVWAIWLACLDIDTSTKQVVSSGPSRLLINDSRRAEVLRILTTSRGGIMLFSKPVSTESVSEVGDVPEVLVPLDDQVLSRVGGGFAPLPGMA